MGGLASRAHEDDGLRSVAAEKDEAMAQNSSGRPFSPVVYGLLWSMMHREVQAALRPTPRATHPRFREILNVLPVQDSDPVLQ